MLRPAMTNYEYTWGQFNCGIGTDGQFQFWNCLFKKIRIDKFLIGIEVSYNKLNPHINLPFNYFIQKYFFHDNPTWNINYSE